LTDHRDSRKVRLAVAGLSGSEQTFFLAPDFLLQDPSHESGRLRNRRLLFGVNPQHGDPRYGIAKPVERIMRGASIISAGPRRGSSAACTSAVLLGLTLGAAGCSTVDGDHSAFPWIGTRTTVTSFAPLVSEVIPAVVNVSAVQRPGKVVDETPAIGASPVKDRGTVSGLPPSALDQLLRRFFDDQQRRVVPRSPGLALGSGFIIDPDGYIVTDDHVLENTDNVTVTFHDGTQHRARIIGRDSLTDLALLKVDAPRPLPYVRWGDSDAARVGDWVLAIGNPFGLDDTVSSGIISARGRDIHSGPYDDFLQIDASINRGNSGGPTFDLRGEVIGINSAIYSPNGGSVGIGFAIPANLAKPIVDQLRDHGRVQRGWLGVQIQEVTPELARGFGLAKPAGALVAGLSADGPAARAGFAQGDVILTVNGHDVGRMRDLPLVVAEMPVGRSAVVSVWRHDREIILRPVIGQMPESPETVDLGQGENEVPQKSPIDVTAGLKLAPLTAEQRRRQRIPSNINGVVVTAIGVDSPFSELDLVPGDVIQTIDQQAVASPGDALAKIESAAASANKTVMLINRHGTSRYLALSLANHLGGGSNG
jgi:serine protease Do